MKDSKQIRSYKSNVAKATVTVIGEPNIDIWAKKVQQVCADIDAGRYKKRDLLKNV